MKGMIRQTSAPLVSLVLIMLGTSFFNTYVSVRLTMEGHKGIITGFVYAGFYAGMMTGALRVEPLIRRIGHIRAFALFASVMASLTILQGLFLDPYIWLVFRFVAGFATAGLFIVIESWLLLLSSPETRGKVLSLYMIALYLAQASGQFFLSVIDLRSFAAFGIAVFFCSLSVIPVSLMRAAAPTLTHNEFVNIWYVLRKTPLGFMGNLVAGMVLGSFYAMGPVFGELSHFTPFQISLIMGVTIFGGLSLQWPLGHLSDLLDRRKVIIGTALTLTGTCVILFIAPAIPFWVLLILLFLFGGFSFTLYPLSITYCCDFFSSAGITSVTCAALIIYGVGCIIGPLLSPIFMEYTNPKGLFLYAAVFAGLFSLYGIYRAFFYRLPSKSNKEPFIPSGGATGKLTEIDPASIEELEATPPPRDIPETEPKIDTPPPPQNLPDISPENKPPQT